MSNTKFVSPFIEKIYWNIKKSPIWGIFLLSYLFLSYFFSALNEDALVLTMYMP